MASNPSIDEAIAAIRRRAQELGQVAPPDSGRQVDPQILGALADGTLSIDELDEQTLEACRKSIGTSGLVDLLLQSESSADAKSDDQESNPYRITNALNHQSSHIESKWSGRWLAIAASIAIVIGSAVFVHQAMNRPHQTTAQSFAIAWPGNNAFDPHAFHRTNLLNHQLAPGLPDFNSTAGATLGSSDNPHQAWQLATVIVKLPDGFGSGAFISPDGWVLTNYHVVADAVQDAALTGQTAHVQVIAPQVVDHRLKPQAAVDAVVYRVDPIHDLALVKLTTLPGGASQVPSFKLADQVAIEEDCFVIGSQYNGVAWGIRGASVTQRFDFPTDLSQVAAGVDSGHSILNRNRIDVLVTDTAVSNGDSGGPLLNAQGQLIGLTFATSSNVSAGAVGWHIALPQLKDFLAKLPQKPESIPFDLYMAGMPHSTMLEPQIENVGPASDVQALTYRFADGEGDDDRPVAIVSYLNLAGSSSSSTAAPESSMPAGLWGVPPGGTFRFDICVVRRADGKVIIGYANSDQVVYEIRIGDSGSNRATTIWQRSTDGSWSVRQANGDETLVDLTRLNRRQAQLLGQLFSNGGMDQAQQSDTRMRHGINKQGNFP